MMELRRVLQRTRAILADLYGPALLDVVLFGSHARGTAGPDSDVDLLVVLGRPVDVDRELQAMTDVLYEMELEEGVVLSPFPVSGEDFRDRQSPFLITVRREGVRA